MTEDKIRNVVSQMIIDGQIRFSFNYDNGERLLEMNVEVDHVDDEGEIEEVTITTEVNLY